MSFLYNMQSKYKISVQSVRTIISKTELYDIGEGFTLKKAVWHEFGNYYGPPREYWELSFQGAKKPAGKFLVATDGTDHIMSHSFVDSKYRSKGLGTKVYKILAKHYGHLQSDVLKTSRSARRVWEKLNADKLPSKNRGKQNKDRYIIRDK